MSLAHLPLTLLMSLAANYLWNYGFWESLAFIEGGFIFNAAMMISLINLRKTDDLLSLVEGPKQCAQDILRSF